MISNRYEISELRLTGPDVADAIVTFRTGLNVISGASDTGKSYIYQCLYFMLSGSKRPKPLQAEDAGYESAYMQVLSESQGVFTLKRNLGETSYFVWRAGLDQAMVSREYEVYHLKSKDHTKTISTFFLKLQSEFSSGLQLKKNVLGGLQRLTIGAIKQFFMVDEKRIISDESVFFNRGYNVTSLELSAFRTLVTGLDDHESKEVESPDLGKAKISGKIEYLEHLITRCTERIAKLQVDTENLDVAEHEARILSLREIVQSESIRIDDLNFSRMEMWGRLQKEKSKRVLDGELIGRLGLLKKSLEDDVKRLSFVQESNHYFLQLEDVNCPTCGSPLSASESVSSDVVTACAIEKGKIASKVDDLNVTVEALLVEINRSDSVIEAIKLEMSNIDAVMKAELGTKLAITLKELEEHESRILLVSQLDLLKLDSANYTSELEYFRGLTNVGGRKSDYDNSLDGSVIDGICAEFRNVLSAWKYRDNDSVTYDADVHDFKIGYKSRLSFGKGHRALLFSAFLVAVLNYSKKTQTNALHPGILILDSPLTSYKEADLESPTGDDIIPEATEAMFFEYLSNIEAAQVIVFDNKEPVGTTRSKANIVHFSRNKSQGRYGFFPV